MELPRNESVGALHGMDLSTFAKRLQALYLHWHRYKDQLWGSADILAVATPPPADIGCVKSSLLINWLLGYDVPETKTLFGFKQIHFLCLQEDRLLETVVKGVVDVDVVIHRKLNGEATTSDMDYVLHRMCTSNSEVLDEPVVGYIAQESPEGSLLQKWGGNVKRLGLQLSDVTDGLSDFLAINMPDEVSYENEEIFRQHRMEIAERLVRGEFSAYGANSKTSSELFACSKSKHVLSENKFEPIRLPSVSIHPHFGGPQSVTGGVLEANADRFRYSISGRDGQVDIMYANIKHAFFQPQEMMAFFTLIHFHLHDHIIVGNKKTKDVQFLVEEMRVIKTLAGEGIYNLDEDEVYEQMRRKFNGEIDLPTFVERVNGLWQYKEPVLNFEQPLCQFGFIGRVEPYKAEAFIVPTSSCLIDLVCTPYLVIPFSEIELVNLERVGIRGQTNFDIAIVFKDFKRDVMRIKAIQIQWYYHIKKWLNSSAVQYFESRVNFHWRAILKTFTDDPQAFEDVGGWDFLKLEKEINIDDFGGLVPLDVAATRIWPLGENLGYYLDHSESDSEGSELSDADPDEGKLIWESLESKKKRRIKKKAGPGSTCPKRKLRKKAAFGKLRVGPLFSSASKRPKLM